jgi:hypothetical protein
MISSLNPFKNISRGYKGGPNFDLKRNHKFSLDNINVTLDIPLSFPQVYEEPEVVSYPIEDKGWFKLYSEKIWHREYVLLRQENWFYYSPFSTSFRGELGSLVCSLTLHKLPKEHSEALQSPDELGEYLFNEYMQFYNTSENRNDGSGRNNEIRNRVESRLKDRGFPFTPEELEEETQSELDSFGYPDISEYSIKNINQIQWVTLQYTKHKTTRIFYNVTLTNNYYLSFEFTIERNKKEIKWVEAAIKASKKIMESIKLENIFKK